MMKPPKENTFAPLHRYALDRIAADVKGDDPRAKCNQKMVAEMIVDSPDNNRDWEFSESIQKSFLKCRN